MLHERTLSWTDVALAATLSILTTAVLLRGSVQALFSARDPASSPAAHPSSFAEGSTASILVDASGVTATIRSLQGVNAGPRASARPSHLFRQYEDIGVDYVRTHDYCGPVDMDVLFPDLGADPDDERSYDFVCTDRELEAVKRVGEVISRSRQIGFPVARFPGGSVGSTYHWEYSWTHHPLDYAGGGTAWQERQRVVKVDDWRDAVSRSDGQPSQVFYVRYPPVVTGTQTITVAGTAWTEVPDLSVAGPRETVYEFDPRRGEIRFGDGERGRVPPVGAPVRARYESGPHDGFVDYEAVMRTVDGEIEVASCFHSDAFLRAMGDEHRYGFLVVHPYYSSGDRNGGGLDEAHLRTMAGPLIKRMHLEDLQAAVELYAGDRASDVEIAITEYNLFVPPRQSPTPHYGMSLDQGLFVADMVRTLAELDVPLGDLHALISRGGGEGWGNTAVMSDYPSLIPRPAAYVLQLFNQHVAPLEVESHVEDAPLLTGSVPALEVLASTEESGHRLTLLAINKEMTVTITATVAISGFRPSRTATVHALSGPSIVAFNDTGHPTDVKVSETTISNVAQSFSYAFPAHSVTLIEVASDMEQRRRLYLPLVLRQ
jgi:hypothetical protein